MTRATKPWRRIDSATVFPLISHPASRRSACFTTNPAVEENSFVVLEDPESLFAAQNVVPLISKDVVNPQVEQALNEVSAALTTETSPR